MTRLKLLPLALLLLAGCERGGAPTDPPVDSPSNPVYTVRDNGIRCITFPCPTLDVLPTGQSNVLVRATDMDLSALHVDQDEAQRIYSRLFEGGVTVEARIESVRREHNGYPYTDIVVRVTKLLP